MARKPTEAQLETLRILNSGAAVAGSIGGKVQTHADVMDGRDVRCHRTMLTDTPAGSQTQGFIIEPDGSFRRNI